MPINGCLDKHGVGCPCNGVGPEKEKGTVTCHGVDRAWVESTLNGSADTTQACRMRKWIAGGRGRGNTGLLFKSQ